MKASVPVVCRNGHPIYVWGSRLTTEPGNGMVYWWGTPFLCSCGATCKAVDA